MRATSTVHKRGRFQSNSIHYVSIVNNEDELSKAYFNFAFFHSTNAAEMYENAVSVLSLPEQKSLFLQLACRKREVANKLKMERSDTVHFANSPRNNGMGSSIRYLMDPELTSRTTLKEAFDFAYTKETRTLVLYEKMSSAAHIRSTRVLFEYLLESQRGSLLYLDSQVAISNGDLNRPIPGIPELAYAF